MHKNIKDITNQRFGKLTVLFFTGKKDSQGHSIWRCRCDCGKELDVFSTNLRSGTSTSCGCTAYEKQTKIFLEHNKPLYVDGTKINMIKVGKPPNKDGSTGYCGVTMQKRTGKYCAYIKFKGKKQYIGTFTTPELAYEARLAKEEELFGTFLREHNEQIAI